MGYKIVPPDINNSGVEWQIVDSHTVREPLIVKNIGKKAAEDIIKNRPYKDFYSFARKVGPAVNSRIVEAMCDAGMFDRPKKQIINDFENIKKDIRRGKSSGIDIFSNKKK